MRLVGGHTIRWRTTLTSFSNKQWTTIPAVVLSLVELYQSDGQSVLVEVVRLLSCGSSVALTYQDSGRLMMSFLVELNHSLPVTQSPPLCRPAHPCTSQYLVVNKTNQNFIHQFLLIALRCVDRYRQWDVVDVVLNITRTRRYNADTMMGQMIIRITTLMRLIRRLAIHEGRKHHRTNLKMVDTKSMGTRRTNIRYT